MRVRFTRDYAAHIEGSYRVENFKAGQEFDGPFAQQLLDCGCPVEVREAPEQVVDDPDGPGVDLDGDGIPEGSAPQVLTWVGDDIERANRALEAEQVKDKPRAGLITALTKLTG